MAPHHDRSRLNGTTTVQDAYRFDKTRFPMSICNYGIKLTHHLVKQFDRSRVPNREMLVNELSHYL